MEFVFTFLGGLLLSALVAFLISRALIRSRVRQARETVAAQIKADMGVENGRLEERLEASENRNRELQAVLEQERAAAKEDLRRAGTEAQEQIRKVREELNLRRLEELAGKDEDYKKALEEQDRRFKELMAQMSAKVREATDSLLKDRQKEFSDASSQSIGQLLNPLKDNIAELRKTMEEGSKEQSRISGEMGERIKSLMEQSSAVRKSADELAAAFKQDSKVQGDWGEARLEQILSAQGLIEGLHFDTQPYIRDTKGNIVTGKDGSQMRPDVILHLDERREVIIDAKVSLTAYVNYVNAENEVQRQSALKDLLSSIHKHIDELAKKNYSAYIQAPKASIGYVIMFVPNTGALWTALQAEPGLWYQAADRNVYIADEQSLYGALKIVNLTWTLIAQAQNHEKVFELAGEMVERVGMFMEKYDAVGKSLGAAQKAYEEGRKKLDPQGQSILGTTSKLLKLGTKDSLKHPVRPLLDSERTPEAPSM